MERADKVGNPDESPECPVAQHRKIMALGGGQSMEDFSTKTAATNTKDTSYSL